MDPLSDVLRAVRLDSAYFYLVEAAEPWSVAAVAASEFVPRVLPNADHLIPYHMLLSGNCWAGLEGGEQVCMQPGDVIVFPHGDPHLLSSAAGVRIGNPTAASPGRYPSTVSLGPAGPRDTRFVCGFLGCDLRPFNPLLASLPRCIHATGIAKGWLAQVPQQAVTESHAGRIGSETMLTRIAELMFIEVVRRQIEEIRPGQSGWLSGLHDPVVGSALRHMHEHPAHAWTLAELARTIASSRTVLTERFSALVGMPPMLYLTRWRLQLAAQQLVESPTKVANIATRAGYTSEAAFSRAFKRETGFSPAAWRTARRDPSELLVT